MSDLYPQEREPDRRNGGEMSMRELVISRLADVLVHRAKYPSMAAALADLHEQDDDELLHLYMTYFPSHVYS